MQTVNIRTSIRKMPRRGQDRSSSEEYSSLLQIDSEDELLLSQRSKQIVNFLKQMKPKSIIPSQVAVL